MLEGSGTVELLARRTKNRALTPRLFFVGLLTILIPPPSPASVLEPYVTNSFAVDTQDRAAVRTFFNAVYYSGTGIRSGWAGDLTNCAPDATAADYQEAVRTRINFFRAMAGVPADIQFDPVYSAKARRAALIVSANSSISHFPDESFSCFSDTGGEAAAVSNLALGTSGIDSIEAYMLDAANNYRVGHRRWLLYPQTKFMGNGDIDPPDGSSWRRANANWILDENYWAPRPPTRDGFVAWPPPGFVPYQLVFPRWSFSFPDADFTSATVTVTTNGMALPVFIEQLERGYGENTIVFVPGEISPEARVTAQKPPADLTFTVTISGVLLGQGLPTNFTYKVTVFDPAAPLTPAASPLLSGPPEPELGRSNRFVLTQVQNASGYDFRHGILTPFRPVEAGDAPPDVIANISGLYPFLQTNIFASSNAAFHLAHTTPARPQTLLLNRCIVPSDRSELRFQSRLGAASTGQVARVQVSLDDGSSWRDLYTQTGDGLAGELGFGIRRVSLSDFAGRAIQIRFEYGFAYGELIYAPGAGEQIGWYIDDINVTSAQELIVEDVSSSDKPEFRFSPRAKTTYWLDARPRFFNDFKGEWTRGSLVTAVEPATVAPSVQVLGLAFRAGALELEFETVNARDTALYRLEGAPTLHDSWTVINSAELLATKAPSRWIFRMTSGAAGARFFRVTIE